jgi:geranylgeranyl diphosphate synthase type II
MPERPSPTAQLLEWFEERRRTVDNALSTHLNSLKTGAWSNTRLPSSVQYSLTAGGKRLRPILVLEACRVCGGSESNAMPAALAAECVHAFSLIHDDLPAMDDDDLRRGVPTNHKVFGEAMAILAGDWLVTHAFTLLAATPDARAVAGLVAALAAGTEAMVVGQAADIEGEDQPTDADRVRLIHRHKTAALIEACCKMGAIAAAADATGVDAMASYGRHLGLAFQIADDLLDATATTEDLGKRAGKDAEASKQTYPAAFGLDESRRHARAEVDQAAAALKLFGNEAEHLRALAEYVIARAR